MTAAAAVCVLLLLLLTCVLALPGMLRVVISFHRVLIAVADIHVRVAGDRGHSDTQTNWERGRGGMGEGVVRVLALWLGGFGLAALAAAFGPHTPGISSSGTSIL